MTRQAGSITREEILSQPRIWASALEHLDAGGLEAFPGSLPAGDGFLIGAGTSFYLARSLAWVGRSITGGNLRPTPPSDILIAGEDLYRNPGSWSVGISRSGTTTETVRALKRVKELGSDAYALTCHSDSPMAAEASQVLAVDMAAEESVVMTRSFTTMLMALSRWFSQVAGRDDLTKAQMQLPLAASTLLEREAETPTQVVNQLQMERVVVLGQGASYGLACEAALKIKEMAILPSEPFHTLEYRHGPKSIVDDKTLIIAFLSDRGRDLEPAVLREMRELGAKVWAVAENDNGLTGDEADILTTLHSGIDEVVRFPLVLPLMQLYGLELALSRGQDPDNPVNLTQVVTL